VGNIVTSVGVMLVNVIAGVTALPTALPFASLSDDRRVI